MATYAEPVRRRGAASRLAGALTSAYDAGRRAVDETFGVPGPEIEYSMFRAGEATPGALLAKLGTAVFARARSRANYLRTEEDANLKRQAAQLQLRDLESDLRRQSGSYTTRAGRKFTDLTPTEMIALEKLDATDDPTFSFETPGGQKLSGLTGKQSGDLEARFTGLRDAAARAREREKRVGTARINHAAAVAALRDMDAQLSPTGATSLKIQGQASRGSNLLAAALKGDRSAAQAMGLDTTGNFRRQAAEALGIDPARAGDPEALEAALAGWRNDFLVRQLRGRRLELEPQRAAFQQRIAEAAGVMASPEDDFLRQLDELTQE